MAALDGKTGLMQQRRGKATDMVPQDSKGQVTAIAPESFLKMVSDCELTYAAISHGLCQRLISDLNRS